MWLTLCITGKLDRKSLHEFQTSLGSKVACDVISDSTVSDDEPKFQTFRKDGTTSGTTSNCNTSKQKVWKKILQFIMASFSLFGAPIGSVQNFDPFLYNYFYRPQRSCGQGNIFTPVCHSVHRGGGLPQCMLGCQPPPDETPPRSRHTIPGPDTPGSRTLHPPGSRPPRADTPLGADTPWEQTPQSRHPPEADTPLGADPPRADTPPGADPTRKQTPAYSLRAASTHLTGIHSCFILFWEINLFHHRPSRTLD